MPRYFFHVASAPETIRDEEGSDLPDLDTARAEAIEDARSLMSDAILSGRDISQRQIQICNEKGKSFFAFHSLWPLRVRRRRNQINSDPHKARVLAFRGDIDLGGYVSRSALSVTWISPRSALMA